MTDNIAFMCTDGGSICEGPGSLLLWLIMPHFYIALTIGFGLGIGMVSVIEKFSNRTADPFERKLIIGSTVFVSLLILALGISFASSSQ